jgi:DNA sulfur modification protein DndC
VLDLSTPSCGGSRFGCWTCTVVKEDKSLQGFIQSGEAWMEPLNAFRNRLKEVRELPDWRAAFRKDGSPGPGPFLPEKRRLLLRELLELERQVGQPLISDAEIQYIQSVWRAEFDLKDEALQIAADYGRRIGAMDTLQLPNTEQQLLDQLVADRGISPDLVERLLRLVLTEYPDLRVWGAKAALQREIEAAIGASLHQEDAAGVEP